MSRIKKIPTGFDPTVIAEAHRRASLGHWGDFGSGKERWIGFLIFIGVMTSAFFAMLLFS